MRTHQIMRRQWLKLSAACVAAFASLTAVPAAAQSEPAYPTRPIEMIVAYVKPLMEDLSPFLMILAVAFMQRRLIAGGNK